jgi:hypothetical protein
MLLSINSFTTYLNLKIIIMKNFIAFFAALVFIAVGAGCSKDENPTNTDNNQSTLPVGTFKAKINGQDWSASVVQVQIQPGSTNHLMINAVNAMGQSHVGLILREFGDIIEHKHTGNLDNTLDGAYQTKIEQYSVQKGTVKLSKKTSTNIQGTFNLESINEYGYGTDTVRITDGQFNLDY